jgi:NADPH-dependent glutamate synthase beta subunit-like oxidoreductase/ferredoxin
MAETINFKIDGQSATVAPGESILDGARKLGIEIPTLCHNEKISHNTSCFVCVVRDCKTDKYLPACATAPSEGQEVESSSDDVRAMRRSALELLLSEHLGDCEAPCTIACPAHARVEEYVRAGREGDFRRALEIIKERIPLPLSIGRVCPRFCEKDCRRNVSGEPVAINEFKRTAADLYYDEYMEPCAELGAHTVGIVGGGPAGLSTAYFLRLRGIGSVIYDKMPKPGGMLRYGIPEFRLPKDILDREIGHFEKMGGIEIRSNQELGRDFTLGELKDQYCAVAVTIGCWSSASMRAEGEDLADQGIAWLEKIARNDWRGANPGRTIVIGGGDVAMDCLRTALRLGGQPTCLYRRTEKEMPAERIEVVEAKEEGVEFEFLAAPLKLERREGKLVLTCQRMELGEPDASGRRRPVPIEGSEYEIVADTVISAIGQKTVAPDELKTNRWGDVDVSADTQEMEPGVFGAGDCVTGAATIVEAVAGAYKIAAAIADSLAGRPHVEPPVFNVSRGHWSSLKPEDLLYLKEPAQRERLKLEHISIEKRKSSFKEVTATAAPDTVAREGERCFECSCTAKQDCLLKRHSESYGAQPDAIAGAKEVVHYDTRHPTIILDRGKCIKCGTCIKICSEIVNQNLLGLKKRGFVAEVGPAGELPLPDSCTECGACIVECPVGALDWKTKKLD